MPSVQLLKTLPSQFICYSVPLSPCFPLIIMTNRAIFLVTSKSPDTFTSAFWRRFGFKPDASLSTCCSDSYRSPSAGEAFVFLPLSSSNSLSTNGGCPFSFLNPNAWVLFRVRFLWLKLSLPSSSAPVVCSCCEVRWKPF